MPKKLIWLFVFVLVLAGGYIYVNSVLIPIQLKGLITEKAETFLQRPLTYQDMRYTPFKGIVIQDITIYEKDQPDKVFIHIDEIDLSVLLPAIITQKRIVIPSLTLRRPSLELRRLGKGQWNFSDLFKHRPGPKSDPEEKSPMTFFLGGLSIEEGRVRLSDPQLDPSDNLTIDLEALTARISPKKMIDFTARLKDPETQGHLRLNGEFQPFQKKLDAELRADRLPFHRLTAWVPLPSSIQCHRADIEEAAAAIHWDYREGSLEGSLKADADLTFHSKVRVDGKISSDGFKIVKKRSDTTAVTVPHAVLTDGTVTFGQDKSVSGVLTVAGLELFTRLNSTRLSANLDLKNSLIHLDKDRTITGDILADHMIFSQNGPDLSIGADLFSPEFRFDWGPETSLSGDLSGKKIAYTRTGSSENLSGDITVANMKWDSLKTGIIGDLSVHPFEITWQEGGIKIKTSGSLGQGSVRLKDKQLDSRITFQNTVIRLDKDQRTLSSDIDLTGARLTLPQDRLISGDVTGNLKVTHNPTNPIPLSYEGTFELDTVSVENVPVLKRLDNITGQLKLGRDIVSGALSLSALDIPVDIKGSLSEFAQPVLDITLGAKKFDLDKIKPLFKDPLNKMNIDLQGQADAKLTYRGPADPFDPSRIRLMAFLYDNTFHTPFHSEPARRMTGQVEYSPPNRFNWTQLAFDFQGGKYESSGFVEDFNNPHFDLDLSSTDLNAEIEGRKNGTHLGFSTCKVLFYDSFIDTAGTVDLDPDGNHTLDFSGTFLIDSRDLLKIKYPFTEKINALQLSGIFEGDWAYRGGLKDWKNARMKLSTKARRMELKGYEWVSPSLSLQQPLGGPLNVDFQGVFYKGMMRLTSRFDLTQDKVPFRIKGSLEETHLDLLKAATSMKDKDLSGDLSLNLDVSGDIRDKASYTGAGDLLLANGHLWKFKLLKGLLGLILIPEFQNLVFTDGQASFTIQDQKVATDDLILKSTPVDLHGQGSIGFDKSINFRVIPEFRQTEIIRSQSFLKKGPTAFLTQADGYINIAVTGTLTDPKYGMETLPTKLLEKTTNIFKEGLIDLLEEVF